MRLQLAWLPALLLTACAGAAAGPEVRPADADWPVYAGDPGATKYSALAAIDRSNVAGLIPAWTWRTGLSPSLNGIVFRQNF